ncbi:monocarboxylate transporter 11-like isoform X2 [Ornithodoros turicata]|uniref:monocarboxylate transporter 11-like isoform X2 n=1 Tax=Ornithodoros turicata TaxID=34597 RepID=UPI00313868DE
MDSRECLPVAICASWYVFVSMLLMKAESVLYVGFMEMLPLSRVEASWPLTLCIIVSQVASPMYGILGMWLSDRLLLVSAALVCSFSVMACSLASNLTHLMIFFGILLGLGMACAEVLPFAVVSRHYERYRGTIISILFILCAVAGFVAPLLAEALSRQFGFRLSLLAEGCILLTMLLGCIYVNRIRPVTEETTTLLTRRPNGTEKVHFLDNLRSLASLWFLHLAVSRAMTLFVLCSVLLSLVDFAKDNGLAGYSAVALATAYAVGDLGSRISAGLLTDFKVLSSVSAMAVSFLIQSASLFGMTLHKSFLVLMLCCFLAGLSGGGRIFLATFMVCNRYEKQYLAFNLGIMNAVSGFVRDVLGTYDKLYLYFALINAIFTFTWTVQFFCQRREL